MLHKCWEWTLLHPTIKPCRAYILLNLEPELDAYDPQAATKTLGAADLVVMMSAYKKHIPLLMQIMLTSCFQFLRLLKPQVLSSIQRDVYKTLMGSLRRLEIRVLHGRY